MHKAWTDADNETLRRLARRRTAADIAAALGRSYGATMVQAHKLGVSLRIPRNGAAPDRIGQHSVGSQPAEQVG